MRKLLLAVAAVVVAVAAAIHWWPARDLVIEPAAKRAGEPTEALTEHAPPEEVRAPAVEAERHVDRAPATPSDESGRAVVDASSAAKPPLDPKLTPGRIVLRDGDGREIPPGSGTLRGFWIEGDGGFGTGWIPVVDGRFTVEIPAGRTLQPTHLELGGEHLLLKRGSASETGSRNLVAPDANGELVIEAERARPLRLHAVDAATRAELSRVSVYRSEGFPLEDTAHPGTASADDLLADGQPSPITLALQNHDFPMAKTTSLRVGAPGYAWSKVEIDYGRGGDVTVELAPGGAIDATISGDYPRAAPSPRPAAVELEGMDASEIASAIEALAGKNDVKGNAVLRIRQPYAPPPDEEEFDLEFALAKTKERIAALSDEQRAMAFPDGVVPDDAALRALIVQLRERAAKLLERVEMSRLVAELVPAADGPTRIDGLAPGRYFVTLEQGDHWNKPRLLARTDVEVRAGATALAQLFVSADDRPATVPLRGRVRLSPAWGETSIDLHFDPIDVPGGSSADEFELDVRTGGSEAGPEWHPFDAGTRLPGRWLVKSYGVELQQVVDTGPSGRSDVEIVFGDPADVVVHLLDDSTGTTIVVDDRDALMWNGARPDGSSGGTLEDAPWDEELGAWCFRAPAGEIEMQLWGDAGYLFKGLDDVRVRIEPGRNEFTYRLQPLQALEVRFEVDGLPMQMSRSWEAKPFSETRAVSVASGATAHLEGWGDSSIWFTLPDAGRWRVELGPILGIRPIAPFEVDVPARKMTVHRVALVRDDG